MDPAWPLFYRDWRRPRTARDTATRHLGGARQRSLYNAGALESFRPNVFIDAFGQVEHYTRSAPLTDDEVRGIVKHFRAGVTER